MRPTPRAPWPTSSRDSLSHPATRGCRRLRGRLLVEDGRPAAGLATLDRALAAGAGGRAHAARARALWELARYQESIAEWTLALRDDPEDADAFVGRARCFASLGRWDPALADLESAVDCSYDRPAVLARAALVYASCLPERPNRLSRVLGLAFRAPSCRATGPLIVACSPNGVSPKLIPAGN